MGAFSAPTEGSRQEREGRSKKGAGWSHGRQFAKFMEARWAAERAGKFAHVRVVRRSASVKENWEARQGREEQQNELEASKGEGALIELEG